MPSLLRLPPVTVVLLCLLLSSLWKSEAHCPHSRHPRHNHRHSHFHDEDYTPSTASSTVDSAAELSTPTYVLPSDYESWRAEHKLRYVWSQLLVNQTTATLVELSEGLIFTESMVPTVAFNSDLIPAGRRKAVHGDGVVCKVRFRPRRLAKDMDKPYYTGVLAQGGDSAIMRLSSVLDPSGQLIIHSLHCPRDTVVLEHFDTDPCSSPTVLCSAPVVGGVVPSIAIKVFRDGQLSANLVALNTQQPQTETSNPFFLPLTNQVRHPPTLRRHTYHIAHHCGRSSHSTDSLCSSVRLFYHCLYAAVRSAAACHHRRLLCRDSLSELHWHLAVGQLGQLPQSVPGHSLSLAAHLRTQQPRTTDAAPTLPVHHLCSVLRTAAAAVAVRGR